MTSVPACTIVSNNYLAFARVFADSYRRFHPDAQVFVCVVDEPAPGVCYAKLPFATIFAEELGVPDFFNFSFRYDILELNTAVKPFFLSYLRDHCDVNRVLYFDPDILVQSGLHELMDRLDRASMLLTPHITEPLDNIHHPAELTIRQAGVYNLGFLGLRLDDHTEGFLDWWQDRMHQFCLVDLSRGLFVDQSWMDLAPAYLDDVAVVRDAVYNVAYWNLAHRFPRQVDGDWYIDGRRIGFTHFSGIDVDDLHSISKHQNRLDLTQRPELRPLFEAYRRRLVEAGHEDYRHLPYRYGRFRGIEVQVPPCARRLLRRIDPRARRWQDPFDTGVGGSYFRWLIDPLRFDAGSLNRLALSLWEVRPDLVSAFPRPCDEDLHRYVAWLTHHAEPETGIDPIFLRGLEVNGRQEQTPRLRGKPFVPHDLAVLDRAVDFVERTDLSNPGRLVDWLNQPAPRAAPQPLITYLAVLLHQSRADLQRAFPDPCGEDQREFARWFVMWGSKDHRLHPSLVEPVLRSLATGRRWRRRLANARDRLIRRAPQGDATREQPNPAPVLPEGASSAEVLRCVEGAGVASPALGVNLGAYFGMDTGIAKVGRGSVDTLRAAGIPFVCVPLDGQAASEGAHSFRDGTPFPVTLLHANADETPAVLSRLPTAVAFKSYRIGYWFWELQHFPLAFADRFALLDEIWAPTRFCLRAYEMIATIPVRRVPPHVPPPSPATRDRVHFGLDEQRFYFFSCFDMGSVPERKNALGVLEAFERLHDEVGDEVGLLLKVTRPELAPPYLDEIRRQAQRLPVEIHTTLWSRTEMDQAIASCDAFLSLHRSEGLGLLPIESLYLETPVVATAYGGVTDFLDESDAFLVDYRLRSLDRDYRPYPAGAAWAEPDLDHAVDRMARVMAFPSEAKTTAQRGRARVTELYGLEAAAARFKAEFDRIAGTCGLGQHEQRSTREDAGVRRAAVRLSNE